MITYFRVKKMKESYRLLIKESADTKMIVEKLKSILLESKVELVYDPIAESLIFNFDTNEVKRKLNRNAGRKRKTDDIHMTVGEVRKLMQEKRPEEIYGLLGISKATYYRRIAQMEEKSDMEWFLS